MLSGQEKEVELLAPDRCDAQEVQSLGRSEHLGADHYLFLSRRPLKDSTSGRPDNPRLARRPICEHLHDVFDQARSRFPVWRRPDVQRGHFRRPAFTRRPAGRPSPKFWDPRPPRGRSHSTARGCRSRNCRSSRTRARRRGRCSSADDQQQQCETTDQLVHELRLRGIAAGQ